MLGLAPVALATDQRAALAQGTTRAFTGVRLIDGTDRPPIPNATIVVQNGRIVAAGPAARVRVPAGAERVALDGKVVIPGIINAHGHVNGARDLDTYAAYGVTTVYSLGGEPADVFAAADQKNMTKAVDGGAGQGRARLPLTRARRRPAAIGR